MQTSQIAFPLLMTITSGTPLADHLAPKVKLRSRNRNPPWWFNSSFHQCLHCVKMIRKKHRLKPTTYNKQKLDDAEQKHFDLMSAAKTFIWVTACRAIPYHNGNKIFKHIKNIINRQLSCWNAPLWDNCYINLICTPKKVYPQILIPFLNQIFKKL